MSITISIIIPTYNRIDLLEKCLDALSPSTQQKTELTYEIIVTDDSPNLKTADFINLKHPHVTHIKGPQKGPASNRNNGAKKAKGDWLIFIDDDCIPNNNLIQNYSQEIAKNEFEVLEGKIFTNRPRKLYKEEAPLNLKGNKMWSCNIAIKKNLFLNLNGFDEDFPFAAMEDVDLHFRIKQQNIPIKFVENAAVMHPWRKHPGLQIVSKRQKSFIYLLKKHPELKKKHNLKWFLINIKNNIVSHIKYFKITDIPFAIIRNFLICRLFIKTKLISNTK